MKKIENLNSCTACTACYSACPTNCIKMIAHSDGFLYPQIDKEKCISCNKCERVCPELDPDKRPVFENAWYGWTKNEQVRKLSSSGGFFTELANDVLNQDGVVYGTVFDYKTRNAVYISTKEATLEDMRKSKYVQSELKDTISNIKQDLDMGKKVLFVGSACHVAGVKKILKNHKNYNKLILCDFICHGVPSPKILREHLNYIENKKGKKIKSIDFRPKNHKIKPWSNYSLKIEFEDNEILNTNRRTDWYMQSFLKQNTILRKCCFDCKYSNQQHLADITVADFWGINKYKPELNDQKGISLIIANTEKGQSIVTTLKEQFNLFQLEWTYAKYIYKSHNYYNINKRNKFFKLYNEQGYQKSMKKCVQTGIYMEIMKSSLRKIKTIIKIR